MINEKTDLLFVDKLREIIEEFERYIDSVAYDIICLNKDYEKLITSLSELEAATRNKNIELIKEKHILNRFYKLLEKELENE